jgi:TIR domain
MAFLRPHFECDVFVSYSHGVRDGDTNAPLKDWTLKLIRRLETDIRAVDTEFDDLNIWRDEQIDRTIHITDELRAKVRSAGILMIVMSRRYLASTWCHDELEWFRQQVRDRTRDQGRVFVIRALPTDETSWPDFLRDTRGHALPGFQFHDKRDSMPYGWRGADTNRDAYVQELWRLTGALVKRLRELRSNAEHRAKAEAPATAAPATGPRRIYLHARREYATVCDEVKRVLSQGGIASLSAVADPGGDMADWTRESRARIETAKRCDALALVHGDERFIDDLFEVGVDERERIQSARGAPLPCAVLDRSGQRLPVDLSGFGIERFDLACDDWRGKFHGWLDQTCGLVAAAP